MRWCVVFAMVIVVSGPAAAWCGQYVLTDLGSLGGFGSNVGNSAAPSVDSPPATGANGGVNGVNANGEIVGWYVTSDSFTHAFSSTLDDPGNLVDLGTLGGTYSVALGVNSQGEIVGQSTITPDDSALHAFLYDGGAMVDLNTLLVAGSGWSLLDATSINDQGWIVGNGIDPAGQSQGFLLTPLPVAEPSSLVLLGAGGVCLAALVRRWRKSRKALCPVKLPRVRSK